MGRKHKSVAIWTAVLLAATAMGEVPDPALQVNNPSLKVTWAESDRRAPPFDKVMMAPVELEFRAVPALSGPIGAATTRTEFPIPERGRQMIAATFDEVFRDQLGESKRVALTAQPTAGVLLLKPALRDIVSRIPPEDPVGMSRTYVSSVMDATLVIDFVDAATGRVLGTAVDRGTAEPPQAATPGGLMWSNPVSVEFEIRKLARRWAMSLESRVEQLYFEAKPR